MFGARGNTEGPSTKNMDLDEKLKIPLAFGKLGSEKTFLYAYPNNFNSIVYGLWIC
jgi:hypothetical protein